MKDHQRARGTVDTNNSAAVTVQDLLNFDISRVRR